MRRSGRQRRPPAKVDLEEIAPNRFLIHNPRTQAILKGEGTIAGRRFELTTWRREGLLARLRQRGFHVRTLADQLAELPALPAPAAIGGPGWWPLTSSIERISYFDPRDLRWQPLTPEIRDGARGVAIYDGWVLRRRKGRGTAAYYLASVGRSGRIDLQPLDETKAILTGYAQARALYNRALVAARRGDTFILPDVEIPPPHRALLRRVAQQTDEGWAANQQAWPLVQDLFDRLGVRLVAPKR